MPFRDPKDIMRLYEDARSLRSRHENDWRLVAAYCLPRHYSGWQTGGPPALRSSLAVPRVAYDSTGVKSLPKYVSVLSRMATPRSQKWHMLTASDTNLMRIHAVQQYFDALTDVLFRSRYEPAAKFEQSSVECYESLGVYGTAPVYIGQRRRTPLDPFGGLSYKSCHLKDIFLLTDDDGNVVRLFRLFWLTARQFAEKFPDVEPPNSIASELKKPDPSERDFFEFLHYIEVKPFDEYDPTALDLRRFPVSGRFISVRDEAYVGREHGFKSFPYVTPRTFTEPGDPYGFSPAMQALPALGSASAVKKSYLKQGQRAADQVLLAHDDAMINGRIDLNPGRVNYGAVDAQGRRLVYALETGDFRIAEGLLQDERRDIEDCFFVTLFQILMETPQMSATEVIERVAEKSALLAPTMGRLQTEWLAPCIRRELDVLFELGRLPEMPPELVEADGDYEIVYTSPLAKGMYAEEISGFMRSLEIAMQLVSMTQDLKYLDHFNLDAALPEIADHLAVPARWLNTPAVKAAIREARQDQLEAQQAVEAGPAMAGMMKTLQE